MSETGSGTCIVKPFNKAQCLMIWAAGILAGMGAVVFFNLVPIQFGGVDISHIAANWVTYPGEDGVMVNERHWLSVQAFLWVAFFAGLAELWIRHRGTRAEALLLKTGLLPEDDRCMLTAENLSPIYVRAHRSSFDDAVLPAIICRLVKEFKKSLSVERVNTVLNSSLDLMQHSLDLRYTALRYLVWILPTLGFLGTVIGIADALAYVGGAEVEPEALLLPTTQRLGVAFHTTLLALMQTSVLMLGLNWIQTLDEQALNKAGQYCLDNLVIRLVEPTHLSRN